MKNREGNIRQAHAGVPDSFKPFRDRHTPTLTVPCPQCGADVGSPCLSSTTGKPLKSHVPRRRMAVRLQNEDL